MRDIKFRVWDKVNKRFYPKIWNLMFLFGGIRFAWDAVENNRGETMITDLPENCYELMQYTGLKDKNGKEIYEGDIINDGDPYHNNSLIVEYDVELCGYCPFVCDGSPGDEPSIPEFSEVIGNIYENPELLKGD